MKRILEKCKGFGDMKLGRSAAWRCLAMGASVLLLLGVVLQIAVPAYGEINALWQQRQAQQDTLLKLQEFATVHADFGAYEEARYKELVQLKQGVQQLEDSNLLQRQLQLVAAKQRLQIKAMQVATPVNVSKGVNDQLRLELAGEYFALLRWLKQVERLRLTVESLEIKGLGKGMVSANCLVSYPKLELPKRAVKPMQ